MSLTRQLSILCMVTSALGTADRCAWAESSPRTAPASSPPVSEISIPNTRRIDFVSKVNGHRYSISVALPFVAAPAGGYGVLYVLDGYAYFESATEAARLFNAPTVVIVGVGYPIDARFAQTVMERRGPPSEAFSILPAADRAAQVERVYDLTLSARDEVLNAEAFPGTPPMKSENVGGLDDFLKTIETEIKPRVAALAPVNPANQAIFGHSLGGLAALHALFVEPTAFRTFIIASPSIWWNNRAVLADEPRFAAAIVSGQATPRVLVTVGADESSVPDVIPESWGPGLSRGAVKASIQKARMVRNAAELSSWLRTLHGSPGYVVDDFALFAKQNHIIAPWPALGRGIAFAFSSTH
jgi:uncharacterized protein